MKPIILFWILVVSLVFRRLSNFTSVPIQPPKIARHTPLTSSKGRSTKAFTTVRASTYPWQILGEPESNHILSFKLLNDNIHRASSEKTGYAPHLIHRPVYPILRSRSYSLYSRYIRLRNGGGKRISRSMEAKIVFPRIMFNT